MIIVSNGASDGTVPIRQHSGNYMPDRMLWQPSCLLCSSSGPRDPRKSTEIASWWLFVDTLTMKPVTMACNICPDGYVLSMCMSWKSVCWALRWHEITSAGEWAFQNRSSLLSWDIHTIEWHQLWTSGFLTTFRCPRNQIVILIATLANSHKSFIGGNESYDSYDIPSGKLIRWDASYSMR
jgi:hypothetical protein